MTDKEGLGVKPVDWVKIARVAYWRRLGLIDAGRQALSEHPL